MSTWDPSGLGANIVLSGANLTAAKAAGFSAWTSAKCTASKAAGLFYFSITVNQIDGGNGFIIGLGNSSQSTANYPGSSGNSVGVQGNIGNWYPSFGSPGPIYVTGDRLLMAFNMTTGKVWARANSTWPSGWNPSTNAGGITHGIAGDLYPMIGLFGSTLGDSGTADFSSSDPDANLTGFSPFDAAPPTPNVIVLKKQSRLLIQRLVVHRN